MGNKMNLPKLIRNAVFLSIFLYLAMVLLLQWNIAFFELSFFTFFGFFALLAMVFTQGFYMTYDG